MKKVLLAIGLTLCGTLAMAQTNSFTKPLNPTKKPGGTPAKTVQSPTDYYLEGGYGVIPMGMTLPLTWYAPVTNESTATLTNVEAALKHIYQGDTITLASEPQANIPAGATDTIVIDERGFWTADYPGWYGYSPTYNTPGLPAGYTGHCLPTNTLGQQAVLATLTAGGQTVSYPTRQYNVVGNTSSPSNDNLLPGYRWARDNGVLSNGCGGYRLGYDYDGTNTNVINNSTHSGESGYTVLVRYTTGSIIPTDDNGEPWVMRGIEMIADPSLTAANLDGTQLIPLVRKAVYNTDNAMSFQTVETGVNANVFEFYGYDIANNMTSGNILINENGNYNAVNIFFPEQVELEPNTSYYIGYRLNGSSVFAVATCSDSGNFAPNDYDVFVEDPYWYGGLWSGFYSNDIPMIRAIVGPEIQLPKHSIYVSCGDGAVIMFGSDTVCGEEIALAEGGSYTLYIYPTDNYELSHLYIDGQEVLSFNADELYGDPNFYSEGYYDDYRHYWSYTFENIQASHIISVSSEYIPPCSQPTVYINDVDTNGTAYIGWEGNTMDGYDVEYGPAGFAHGTGTILQTYNSSITITGLAQNTSYDVYVRSRCLDSTYSEWSEVVTISTALITIVNHGGGFIHCQYEGLVYDTTQVVSREGVSLEIATIEPTSPYMEWFNISVEASRIVHIVVDGIEYNLNNYSLFADVYIDEGIVEYVLSFTDGMPHTVDVYFGSYYGTLTAVANNDTLGFVTGGGVYMSGTEVTITAVSYAGATFTGWNDGSTTVNPLTYIMGENDTTITAIFAPASTTEVVHDTVTMPVYDTTIVTIHDTTVVTNTVHDTTVVYADTTYIEVEVHDTIYLFDTVFIHDTIIIYDTTVTGVDEVVNSVRLYGENGQIVVEGSEGAAVILYDAVGRMLATRRDDYGRLTFDVPASGVYMVKVGNHPARKVVVVR